MVGTIVPVVYGHGARKRLTPVVVHVAGAVTGGAVVGTVLGYLGSVTPGLSEGDPAGASAIGITGTMALVLAPKEAALLRVPVPQLHRQVTQRWRRRTKPWVTALAYGMELGLGVTTFVPTATFYVLLTACYLSSNAGFAAVVMATFGAARAAPILLLAASRPDLEGVTRVGDSLPGWEPLVHLINAMLLSGAGAFLVSATVAST